MHRGPARNATLCSGESAHIYGNHDSTIWGDLPSIVRPILPPKQARQGSFGLSHTQMCFSVVQAVSYSHRHHLGQNLQESRCLLRQIAKKGIYCQREIGENPQTE